MPVGFYKDTVVMHYRVLRLRVWGLVFSFQVSIRVKQGFCLGLLRIWFARLSESCGGALQSLYNNGLRDLGGGRG